MPAPDHDREHRIAHRIIPTASTSLIKAALHVLADGRARDAGKVLTEAVKAGLLPDSTRRITLYTSLSQYVQRASARRRRPLIVQDETTHEFRINHPVDDWPDVKRPRRRAAVSAAAIEAIAHRLHTTSTSTQTEAFEIAVCDAFAALGFIATHHGGIGAPDGVLEAPLGPLAYRAIIECKTAQPGGTVNAPRLEEPAKFREAYKAQSAVLVGPALSVDSAFESEMQTPPCPSGPSRTSSRRCGSASIRWSAASCSPQA